MISIIIHMSNQVAREIGQAVGEALHCGGLTKTWLSDETGIPYPTLNRKIAGKSEFHFSELLLVSEALGVSPVIFTPQMPARDEAAA